MSHEKSITFQHNGVWVNAPSVYKGKTYSSPDAQKLYREGKTKLLDGRIYHSAEEAVKAAKKRSEAYKPKTLMQKR